MADYTKSQLPKKYSQIAYLIVTTTIVGLIAISHQSLWMDEGSSAFKAIMPDLKEWWFLTRRIGGSDIQMPVYMFLLWAWQKLGPSSEYALRAMNLPCLLIAVIALNRVRFWPLVCLTSPFVLYYVGELRPYAMQIAAGTLGASAMIEVAKGREKRSYAGLNSTAVASLLLAGSSLTAAVWSFGLWLGVLIIRTDWLSRKSFWYRISPWVCGAVAIASYYLYTLLSGYRATGMDKGGFLSSLFGFYELLGMLGLGPSRNELRIAPCSILSSLPILVPAFVCFTGAWTTGVIFWRKTISGRTALAVACATLLPVIILITIGYAMNFRVLGRHFSPIIPAILLPIAKALAQTGAYGRPAKVLAVFAIFFAATSALELRFLNRHSRDDYRKATDIAIEALQNGQRIWWQADMNATRYYAFREGGQRLVNQIQSLESEIPSSLMFADIVVINRPDLRYNRDDYKTELRRNSFALQSRFTGFEVWKAH